MKIQNGLLNKVFNRKELELETFDLIDVFSSNYEEQVEEYRTHAAALEMDVSSGIIPFPLLSRAEIRTWEIYCPQKDSVKNYKATIPLDVLRLATIVTEKKWFHDLQVWSENKEEIDPILVGKINDRYDSPLYLLARWGASLKPFEQIREQAKKIWREARIINIESTIAKAELAKSSIDKDCLDHFNGEWVNTF